MARKGPGLLLRDLMRGDDPQITAILTLIDHADVDILLIQSFDYDHDSAALSRFADLAGYPHHFARRPLSGWQVGLDVDGDGRLGEPEDALGFGWFAGQGGMAVLSRYPINAGAARDFGDVLWKDVPETLLPPPDADWPSAEVHARLPLASVAHWAVPVEAPGGALTLLAFHAAPPVFDGPEDRNGRRNADQIRFWQWFLDGRFGPAPKQDFVLLGDANLDPQGSDGRHEAIRNLLADPRLQDPVPRGLAGPNTVRWPDLPGPLRVSYILPASEMTVTASGVLWPEPGSDLAGITTQASRHRLVWVDIER